MESHLFCSIACFTQQHKHIESNEQSKRFKNKYQAPTQQKHRKNQAVAMERRQKRGREKERNRRREREREREVRDQQSVCCTDRCNAMFSSVTS